MASSSIFVFERAGDAVSGLNQLAQIGGEEEVGGAVAPFQRDALDQAAFGEEHIDADSGSFLKAGEEWLDQKGLPVGIDIDGAVVVCVLRGGGGPGRA